MASYKLQSGIYAKHSLDLENLTFSMFTPEELKKLCVVKITTPFTFDNMGYAIPGGLYDKALGPISENSDPCGSCLRNIYMCPGHFGYIELPLPLLNPIFHKRFVFLMRVTCIKCNRFEIPNEVKELLVIQLRLIDSGLVTEATEIDTLLMECINERKELKAISEGLQKKVKKAVEAAKSVEYGLPAHSNKMHDLIRMKALFKPFQFDKHKKRCIHCHALLNRIQCYKSRFFIVKRKERVTAANKKKKGKKGETEGEKEIDGEESATDDNTDGKSNFKLLMVDELRTHLRNLWDNEKELLMEVVPVLKHIHSESPTDVMFFEIIPVIPPNIRPVNVRNGRYIEHPQTHIYKQILQNCIYLKSVILVTQGKSVDSFTEENRRAYASLEGGTDIQKLHNLWQLLQNNVYALMDIELSYTKLDSVGLRQIIEKKKGIIRMNMMGKRVNFAARSVITPDPNLNIDEIGIPEEFAKKLTYPIPVTPWNIEELRKMVLNGPDVHPGATMVEFENGTKAKINSKNTTQQESILKRLLTPIEGDDLTQNVGIKIVHRHLCNGDVLLLNRQPTLHKPSIMSHTARILKDEKTIRLHYANCKAYNADFDGDEMNAHFPQNDLARSEGYNITNVCNQYLVPKDGTPLSGLIQDHMISGVRLSMRGRFFTKSDYQQLVYQALSSQKGALKFLPPTIIKPAVLWSGKQILSTVIKNIIPKNRAAINLVATAKISAKDWINEPAREWLAGGTPFSHPNTMTEAEVVIRNGELLSGVLDKTHYGATPYGLVHCIYELYGPSYATKLLSSFAKLFTCFLQQEGFTLGVRDILVLPNADKQRSNIIEAVRRVGSKAAASALDVAEDQFEADELQSKLEQAYSNNVKFRTIVDRQYKSTLDTYTNQINKACLPAGLLSKFPHNNLQLMVQSGAKGSTVNTMQISCLLGQIELEGKRPPVMISGKSLPSFTPYETSPKAGGFIDGRFMTGIQPQEFFFHCMAGREGLIDTAVKTSRSGYLQRCLVKHLEGLKVGYDLTVRDSDQSVIQFLYGEDGMDVCKAQFLKDRQLPFLADNSQAIVTEELIEELKDVARYPKLKKHVKQLRKSIESNDGNFTRTKGARENAFTYFSTVISKKLEVEQPNMIENGRTKLATETCDLWRTSAEELRQTFKRNCASYPDPADSKFQPDVYYGSINDRLMTLLVNYKKSHKVNEDFTDTLQLKAMQSLAAPGESVGLLAAQSIGEPSTQMTLNTFHFAGRGEMNVTLGIPRLREILMMASERILTPSMEVPFLNVPNVERKAERLRKLLTRVTVANVLEKIDVSVRLMVQPLRQYVYTLKFHFLPEKLFRNEYNVTSKQVLDFITKQFFDILFMNVRKMSKGGSKTLVTESEKKDKPVSTNEIIEDSSDEEPEGGEEDAKLSSNFQKKHDDQEPEEEEIEASDNELEDTQKDEDEDKKESDTYDVLKKYTYAQNFTYDKKKHSWCEITFAIPVAFKFIDLSEFLKEVAEKSVIWEIDKIKRAITYTKDNNVLTLRTDGINMNEMFKYNKLLDLNKLYSNDIHMVTKTYGIEAARCVIVKEVQEVFKVYGITVDPRHLLLIADYMTFNGSFEPLSRKGMEHSTSPLQQISFESSLTFLREASIQGKYDYLASPSSCLMVGKPCTVGTGSFKLLQKIPGAM